MGERGPKSNMMALPTLKTKRPNPLQGMTPKARTVWIRIVKAYPSDHFKPQHFDQLRAYCEASALHKIAVKEAEKANYTDINFKSGVTKESHWVGIMDKMAGRMQGLAVKLGISKNNTLVNRGKSGESTKPKSKRGNLIFNG